MKRSSTQLAFWIGLGLAAAGLVWGGFFAGIPYQDATPTQEASFAWHARISRTLMGSGLLLLVVSGAMAALRIWRRA